MQQPTPREVALDYVRRHRGYVEAIVAGERPRWNTGEGGGGPLWPHVTVHGRELIVNQSTPEEWASQVAWHTFCRSNGYPTGKQIGWDQDPSKGYPPSPPRASQRVHVTLVQLRAWLTEESDPQLSLMEVT